jgi:hypothetical protein
MGHPIAVLAHQMASAFKKSATMGVDFLGSDPCRVVLARLGCHDNPERTGQVGVTQDDAKTTGTARGNSL